MFKYYLIKREELIKDEKTFQQVIKFETLQQAIGYALKNGSHTDYHVVKVIEDWSVVEKK